jgi:hypothetical protein
LDQQIPKIARRDEQALATGDERVDVKTDPDQRERAIMPIIRVSISVARSSLRNRGSSGNPPFAPAAMDMLPPFIP